MPKPLSKAFQDYSLGERINQLREQYGDDHPEVKAIGGPAKLKELEEKRIAYLRSEFGPEHLEVKAHDAGLNAVDVVQKHSLGAEAKDLLPPPVKKETGNKPSDKESEKQGQVITGDVNLAGKTAPLKFVNRLVLLLGFYGRFSSRISGFSCLSNHFVRVLTGYG